MPQVHDAFAAYAVRKLEDHFAQIRRCVGMLSDEQLWFRPNAHSNSVGNLLLHLNGNVGQWILGGVGGRPVERNRHAEFDARGPMPKRQALDPLIGTMEAAYGVIRQITGAMLIEEKSIQTYRVSVLAVVMHVVEHFAFHTGQIVTTTKWLLDADLSLYDENGHRRDGRKDDVP